MQQKWTKGFTLLELMIVVAIVGVMAAIAYPSYLENAKKIRRADAQTVLVAFSSKMETYFLENNTFLGAGTDGTPPSTGLPQIFPQESPIDGAEKYYDLTISAATATTYTLRAVPKGAQVGDGRLELASDDVRTWSENDNGSGASKDW